MLDFYETRTIIEQAKPILSMKTLGNSGYTMSTLSTLTESKN